ncbi:MAG: CDP-diacylglycerol--glycerol-3-phosphate 3-phosphatidyltransferase [Spirochaetia bacterium]|jgi:CDP-diacylglycerol--glycerol-3-phosphate 3-phosphatidyltransferase|nr:CDP-diacylglycerol--glycerol-3-phosphate 3-phosphatidyltransferase [Spirochaetales bacterium]MDX9784020.1 CDP-diacylglycerol--glycerol-3-phosphate 3-phosphatidyltransferase [Spirochaetia bacterium]
MSTADKVTLSRIFLAPVFFILYRYSLLPALPTVILLWLLFIVIELSDLVDGQLARGANMVSDFGKLFDPFADVLARVTYFICFAFDGIMPLWIFLIILYREFSILFLRMMLSGRGIAMGARPGGKLKAGLYMVSGLSALLYSSLRRLSLAASLQNPLRILVVAVFVAAAILSILSFVDYLIQYRKLISVAESHKS